jgi:hypothetical protein
MTQVLACSQTLEKWTTQVNWDGYSHWSKYIIYSPAFMGPNSLQVPSLNNGSIDSVNYFGFEGGFHFSKGDLTQNMALTANYCLQKGLISVNLNWVPVEWFQTSEAVKLKRNVYYQEFYDRVAGGDMVLNTTVQILNRWRKDVHLALRVGYRFPTSNSVGAARFTDAPGYCFDLSAARVLKSNPAWRILAMTGFYVWQMNEYGQNDAYLAGAGTEYNFRNFRMQLYGTGYFGWRNNGDDPVVIGAQMEKKAKHLTYTFHLRQGLHDMDYTSLWLGLRYNISKMR